MKRIIFRMKYIYTLLLIACINTGIHAVDYRNNILYRNIILKESGDSLVMSFDIDISPKALSKNQSLVIIPRLKSPEGESMIFGYVQINGSRKGKLIRRTELLKKTDPFVERPVVMADLTKQQLFIRYAAIIPYEPWMDEAELYRLENLITCAGNTQTRENGFGQKVVTLPKPPAIPPVRYVKPDPIKKQRNMQGSAYLDFRKSSYSIDPSWSRNPQELMRIMNMVYKASKDPDITVHSLSVTGYASPEGNFTFNQHLAQKRAASLKDYIKTSSGLPESIFRVRAVGEDWEMLRKLVAESNYVQKQAILNIIDNGADFDRKESQLKAMGAVYHQLLSDFFPQLRRVEYHIDYTIKDYSITEARLLLNSDPEKLSSHELYLLAQLYDEGSAEWNDIILKTVRLYPDDPAANINAAAVYISTGVYEEAGKCLDKVKNHPDARHNLSVYEEMKRQGLQ